MGDRVAVDDEGHVIAEKWLEINDGHARTLAHLLAENPNTFYPPGPSDRDKMVAATVIQWLGSPVGQGFLRDCGYTKTEGEDQGAMGGAPLDAPQDSRPVVGR